MTEEEKDILQDKVLFEEADNLEIEQHKNLLSSNADYRGEFYLKECIARSGAKDFLEKALETPVIPLWRRRTTWQAIAAIFFIALVSTLMLSDFRTASEFALAELANQPKSSKILFGEAGPASRSGAFNWRRAFDEGNYDLVVELVSPKQTEEEYLIVGMSKLFRDSETDRTDFGQEEFYWILAHPDSVSIEFKTQAAWLYPLALYKSGECLGAYKALETIANSENEYQKKARKFQRKLKRECKVD